MDLGPTTQELSPKSFARFAHYITSELGIKMPSSKLTMVHNRLLRRARALSFDSVEKYGEYFFASASTEEREHFINAITTNKTDFFREPQHFEYLTRTAIPELTGFHNSRLKVWSAACSSGEEPYTLAMVLSEFALKQPGFDFAILATDISTRVLEHARKGIYEQQQIAPVPHECRSRYLLRSRDRSQMLVRVTPALRLKVSFHQLNFMAEEYGLKDIFDVIFLRNVLIYFDKETQEGVINRVCRHLAPGGYLFVGHSESLAGMNVPVRNVCTSVFRKPLP